MNNSPRTERTQYEHRTLTVCGGSAEDAMNQSARDGWRVVQYGDDSIPFGATYHKLVMEREKRD